MRDAFGGAFSIKLMLIFLMLYVSFMCVALSYARAFRVKNRIINMIEEYEGYKDGQNEELDKKIDEYLDSAGYYVRYEDIDSKKSSCTELRGRGYCVVQMAKNPSYYKVETYMVFKIPIMKKINFTVRIAGETRRIEMP